MDNQDGSENMAKISDSAYSNSCSNSQSRRSHSSKSTHSGSNSSGSSGYGGKPSTSGSSNNLVPSVKKVKDPKKKKLPQIEAISDVVVETEDRPPDPQPEIEPTELTRNVAPAPTASPLPVENGAENMDISTSDTNSVMDEAEPSNVSQVNSSPNIVITKANSVSSTDGFSCLISLNDGVVLYATASLTTNLGFPKHMWIGRSFIDFVHPRDRSTFASQITNGLAVPKIVNGTLEKAQSQHNTVPTIVCRIRRYRGLTSGFAVKDKAFTFIPFLLNMSIKNISDEEGNLIYLVIQASPFFSAYMTPNEQPLKTSPFVMRHAANGRIEYVDPESVSYLGFLPQDLAGKNALELYHIDDLVYLRQVYETIVKEGGFPRSKPYRMITQNGDYLKLETKWSSFINPWSKKLVFIIGEHHIVEGPTNPDVFQTAETDKVVKISEEEMAKATALRENIIRIMNEVLTKPAEFAKQQMSKRCQDLALFMESLLEETPKPDEELRLDIQDPDNSYFERDSVMLGGISPHHDYTDGKSSTETPLSYNQLNYNETLQRYFDSCPPHSYEDYNTTTGENILGLINDPPKVNKPCLSPLAQISAGSSDQTHMSACDPLNLMNYNVSGRPVMNNVETSPKLRLTENLLTKHNMEMEKFLMKTHRVSRSISKGERQKNTHETRQKKKEHLARCNASFQPTSATESPSEGVQIKGVKRTSKPMDGESSAHKHHCSAHRASRRRQRTLSTGTTSPQTSAAVTAVSLAATSWPNPAVNNMNTFILGVGIPQQMPVMSPMPGMFPMYYGPGSSHMPAATASTPSTSKAHCQQPTMPNMMYGQAIYGSPIMYAPVNQPIYNPHDNMIAQSMQYINFFDPLNSSYTETCKTLPLQSGTPTGACCEKKCAESLGTSMKTDQCSENSITNTLIRSKVSDAQSLTPLGAPSTNRSTNAEEGMEKTDEDSSSSFYSSFFKTESGSAEESGDAKAKPHLDANTHYTRLPVNKVARRKMDPPWMSQVCVTSELIYKYQIHTKNLDEVLSADKAKISSLEQPPLVNEQLGQLYLDLQLDGVAARLTLEEGITSSGSSGEETTIKSSKLKALRKKRDYSKLVIIYDEDAPMPPPIKEEPISTSTN